MDEKFEELAPSPQASGLEFLGYRMTLCQGHDLEKTDGVLFWQNTGPQSEIKMGKIFFLCCSGQIFAADLKKAKEFQIFTPCD